MLYKLLTDNGMSLEIVVWSLFAGICIAALIIFYTKNIIGPFVGKLIDSGAKTPESAKSVGELELRKNRLLNALLLFSLRHNRVLLKIASCTGETSEDEKAPAEGGKRRKPDPEKVKWYISEEHIEKADVVYVNGGATIFTLLIAVAGFLAAVYLMLKFIPILNEFTSKLGEYVEFLGSKNK